MTSTTIDKIPAGESFRLAGHEYVFLDYGIANGTGETGCLCIESSTLEHMAFGRYNDWRISPIRGCLNEDYAQMLISNGLDPDALLEQQIDLKETNGGREYGYDSCKVGLLTLEQYGKYNELIPMDIRPWWLVTPWGTPNSRSSYSFNPNGVWRVTKSGGLAHSSSNDWGISPRPTLLLAPSLVVFTGTDGDDCDAENANEGAKGLATYTTKELADELARRLE